MLRSLARAGQRAAKAELQSSQLFGSSSGSKGVLSYALHGSFWGKADWGQLPVNHSQAFNTTACHLAVQPAEVTSVESGSPLEGKKGTGGSLNDCKSEQLGYLMTYPKYDKEYLESIKPKHKPAEKLYQKTALWAVSAMRWGFDTATGYPNKMDECRWLRRFVFLETVAGVPGMVGGMLRHMKSLRSMSRDHGWIHTLLEEAENERMHLLTFLQLKQPGPFFRAFVLLSQGVFFNLYTFFYLLSPKHCHAFVGYLEEEAVRTYTHAIQEIDSGNLPGWKALKPPEIGRAYWGLGDDATMRDLILAVRADEYGHSHVNHTFSTLKQTDDNPFEKGAHEVP